MQSAEIPCTALTADDCLAKDNCEVKLNDGTSLELTQAQWNQVIASGLKACGFQS